MTTNRYDNARTGANTSETILTVANVSSAKFGKLFSISVDGHIYAEPLYVPNLTIGGAMHNVVFVATENDTVYAFDADKATSMPLWSKSLGSPMIESVAPTYHGTGGTVPLPSGSNVDCWDMYPRTGITSTPVIDRATGHMYVVAKILNMDGSFALKLHSLDILTGNDVGGSPATISGSVAGTGVGSNGGMVAFNPLRHLNRPGLLLTGGNVYIAFSSHCDDYPYHGWVFSYDASTLTQTGILNTTPNGNQGGIWQSGIGLSADSASNVYFVSGNGTIDSTGNGAALGMSVVRLQLGASGLKVADFFTTFDADAKTANDYDLVGGPILAPNPNVLLAGAKAGKLYVINPMNMGKFNAKSDNIIQGDFLPGGNNDHVHGGPAYWNGPNGPTIYIWPENTIMTAYHFSGNTVVTTPALRVAESASHPGGIVTVSSNGAMAGTGIVWATHTDPTLGVIDPKDPNTTSGKGGDAWHHLVKGEFLAYDATKLGTPIFKSSNKASDDIGDFAKFNPPTVANGKVYVASQVAPEGGVLNVYGLSP